MQAAQALLQEDEMVIIEGGHTSACDDVLAVSHLILMLVLVNDFGVDSNVRRLEWFRSLSLGTFFDRKDCPVAATAEECYVSVELLAQYVF